ncbi:MAG: flagellar biosynthesis protein FliQ [Bradymonadia bacterium]
MTANFVISFFESAIGLAAMLTLPALGLGMFVGLMVSIFQAVTQIQEQTLALIPKIVAIVGALLLFGSWMLTHLVTYTEGVFAQMAAVAG